MILALVWPAPNPAPVAKLGVDKSDSRERCRLLVVNIGDSRAVMCRGTADGALTAVRLSDDHKPERQDERRRIESKGGVVDMQGVWRVFTPGTANFGGRTVQWG